MTYTLNRQSSLRIKFPTDPEWESVGRYEYTYSGEMQIDTDASNVYIARREGPYRYGRSDAYKPWTWFTGVWQPMEDCIRRGDRLLHRHALVKVEGDDSTSMIWARIRSVDAAYCPHSFIKTTVTLTASLEDNEQIPITEAMSI